MTIDTLTIISDGMELVVSSFDSDRELLITSIDAANEENIHYLTVKQVEALVSHLTKELQIIKRKK